MRNKVKNSMTISSWEEANEALRQIGENSRDITAAETVMNEQISNAKAAAEAKCSSLRDGSNMLALALKEFATLHRADMGKRKSKQLTFGTVSFRQSTQAVLPRGADEVEKIVTRLLAAGMDDCVIQPPAKVDRNAIKKYSAEMVAGVGVQLRVKEEFGYELDEAEIAKL